MIYRCGKSCKWRDPMSCAKLNFLNFWGRHLVQLEESSKSQSRNWAAGCWAMLSSHSQTCATCAVLDLNPRTSQMRLWLPPTFQPLPDMPQRVVIECDQQILASNHGFVLQKFDKGTHKFHQSILDAADFQILYCTFDSFNRHDICWYPRVSCIAVASDSKCCRLRHLWNGFAGHGRGSSQTLRALMLPNVLRRRTFLVCRRTAEHHWICFPCHTMWAESWWRIHSPPQPGTEMNDSDWCDWVTMTLDISGPTTLDPCGICVAKLWSTWDLVLVAAIWNLLLRPLWCSKWPVGSWATWIALNCHQPIPWNQRLARQRPLSTPVAAGGM